MTSDTPSSMRFDRIFGEYYEPVSRYCHRRLAPHDANDATAEVFVVAWKKIEDLPRGDHALPWLYGVARNEVRRLRRSLRREGCFAGGAGHTAVWVAATGDGWVQVPSRSCAAWRASVLLRENVVVQIGVISPFMGRRPIRGGCG